MFALLDNKCALTKKKSINIFSVTSCEPSAVVMQKNKNIYVICMFIYEINPKFFIKAINNSVYYIKFYLILYNYI